MCGIAAALADALGHTEIARRLSRPTSTISREVARNGGPTAYRADRAQHATAWRAPAAGGDPDDSFGRDPHVVQEFEHEFAAMMVRTGLAPIPAKVLAALVTSDPGRHPPPHHEPVLRTTGPRHGTGSRTLAANACG